MFTLGASTRIWLATGATDLRRGFNGLHTLIVHQFGQDALAGDLFVFTNRRRDLLKVFYFDAGGIWVCAKRLEKGTFRWPPAGEPLVSLRAAQLQLLLSGIDLTQTRARRWWSPDATPAEAIR
jgi:transposase